ncbi:hypothetical protein C922_02393 [Plasmodium inui San Antonio 1]|uniref:Uncharacterized protein n=1 Tax=Plasmodium inui San Antonio 1 TaxID=1237626 RepID=W7A7G9_9APIC|nr:hypothetical protein C922_02393 [Plasmodium inui San Antonio 1]EUD67243.1 hypothetical protein C922_02393 [Plasmodium inui San Antonio 1]
MKILRIDMLSTDSDLSESNFYSDGQERDLKRMEKKNTNWALYNPGSDVDSDKEYFIDCFEAGIKAIPKEGEVFNKSDTPEEGKKCAADKRAGDNGADDCVTNGNIADDNAASSHGDDDLTSDLENFQSFDSSTSDADDKTFGKKEKIFEQYKINIRTESDISFEEEKSFSHSIELSDNTEEGQSRPLNFYSDKSNDKLLGCAATGENSLHPGKDAASDVGERGDPFEGTDELTTKKDHTNEEEAKEERESHRENEAEQESNDNQIDTHAGENHRKSESANDTTFGETEKTVKESDTPEGGVNSNYRNSTSKKEHLKKMSLTNKKRDVITQGRGCSAGNLSFVLVGGVGDRNSPHRDTYKAKKRSGEVEKGDVAGKVGRAGKVKRKPSRFDPQRNTPLFDYYSTGNNAQTGEWERNQDNQTADELITSSGYEKSEIGDLHSSEPENGDDDENGDSNQNGHDDGKLNHYQHRNFLSKARGPQYLPLYGKRNNLNKCGHNKICLKSPLIRKQSFSEPPEQCRQSENRNAPNKKADHYIHMCMQKNREGRNDFNDPNCYMPPKKPNLYGEKLCEHRKINAPRSVSKRSVGVQINLRGKKEYKKKGNTRSECYIPSYRRVKVKIPVFELKRADIKNYDFDAVLVKDGRVVPRKKDPVWEFLPAYISYVNER